MSIQFLCPAGHKIQCPDDRAGQPAKCPKCGVKFLIPSLAELQAAGGVDSQPGPAEPESGQLGTGDVPPGQEGQIEFLCPNGHHLHGPRSLEATPGECPECGVRFLVPSFDDVPDDDQNEPPRQESGVAVQAEPEIKIVTGDEPSRIQDQVEAVPEPPPAVRVRTNDRAGEPVAPQVVEVSTAPPGADSARPHLAAPAQSLAELFAKLWPLRARGAVVELHLSDGETVVPDRFAQAMSQGTFAMVASTDADGKHTLTAVAWDSVVRVVVRNLGQLPDEFRP